MGLSKTVVPHARDHPGLSPFGKSEPTIWYQTRLFPLTKMDMKTGRPCGAAWGVGGGKERFVPPALEGRETSQESVCGSPGPLPRRDPPSAPARGFRPSSTPPHLARAPPPPPRGSKGGWPATATVTRPLGAAGRTGWRKPALGFGLGTEEKFSGAERKWE